MHLMPRMPNAPQNCLAAVARLLCCHEMDRVQQCVEVLTLAARFSRLVVEATRAEEWDGGLVTCDAIEHLSLSHGEAFDEIVLEDLTAGSSSDDGHDREESIDRRYWLWKRYVAAWYVREMVGVRETRYLRLVGELALITQAFQRLRWGQQHVHHLRLCPPPGQEEDRDPAAYKLFLRGRMDAYASDLVAMGMSRVITPEEAADLDSLDLPRHLRDIGMEIAIGE